jgi:hypothetical protein
MVTVGETEPQEDFMSRILKKEGTVTTIRLFGTNSLKEGAMKHVFPMLGSRTQSGGNEYVNNRKFPFL